MRIEAQNLTYTYSEKSKSLRVTALNDVSLEIREGEFFGIIGHTGSGKSTFVQHLNGLIVGSEKNGKLTVGSFNLRDKKCDFNALRSHVGMVFQYPEYQLFAETVFGDVAFAIKNFFPNLSQDEVKSRVYEALKLVGLNPEEVVNVSPFDLSGGQKRRVAIAGVLVAKPEVLILDEPIVGLDPKGRRELLSLLKDIHKTFVKTIIIITHDMNVVSEYCDRAVIFKNGKVFSLGTPEEIFADEKKVIEAGLSLPITAYLKDVLNNKPRDLKIESFIDSAIKEFGGKV